MTIKVIGAGLGRTGTMSLKAALEYLLGAPCYHMVELFKHLEEHTPLWHAAARGEKVAWDHLFTGYSATVDEPSSILWKELVAYYPDALVILSKRDAVSWWKSASATILAKVSKAPTEPPEQVAWHNLLMDLYKQVHPNGITDPELTQQSFLSHMRQVEATVPQHKLLVWEAGDGWEPICKALNLAVPDEPFPNTNSTKEFLARQFEKPS